MAADVCLRALRRSVEASDRRRSTPSAALLCEVELAPEGLSSRHNGMIEGTSTRFWRARQACRTTRRETVRSSGRDAERRDLAAESMRERTLAGVSGRGAAVAGRPPVAHEPVEQGACSRNIIQSSASTDTFRTTLCSSRPAASRSSPDGSRDGLVDAIGARARAEAVSDDCRAIAGSAVVDAILEVVSLDAAGARAFLELIPKFYRYHGHSEPQPLAAETLLRLTNSTGAASRKDRLRPGRPPSIARRARTTLLTLLFLRRAGAASGYRLHEVMLAEGAWAVIEVLQHLKQRGLWTA